MKWLKAQRWSALVLIALLVVSAHVTLPLWAARAASLTLLFAASAHISASLYVALTDHRALAQRAKLVSAITILLGAGAASYGAWLILRARGPAPIPGHLEGSACERCHERDPHKRWPTALHKGHGETPGLACEDCHSVTVKTPKLLARLDPQLQQHVGVASPLDLCLECHGPRWAAGPVWPGAIHAAFRCGTCHSRVERDGEPSWRRACQKCHPRKEDVHKDVRSLDTTFASPASAHDVHTLRCSSCHAEMK